MKPELTAKILESLPIGHDVDKFFSRAHNHNYYEFLYIIRGMAMNIMDEGVQILNRANILAIRPEDVHFIQKINVVDEEQHKKQKFEFFNIPVPIDFMEKQFEECKKLKKNIVDGELPMVASVSGTELAYICTQALKLSEMKDSEKRRYQYFTLARYLCSFFLYAQEEEENIPEWFASLYVMAERMHASELNYDILVKKAGVSNKTLWKTFKKVLNITPSAYINMRKMKDAYAHILAGQMNLTEIAMHLGYGSYTHFYRKFSDYYGASPREYIKKKKKK